MTNEQTNYKTGENTAVLLDALRAFNNFYDTYAAALGAVYTETAADKILQDERGELNAVLEDVRGHLCDSIQQTLCLTSNNAAPFTI